MSRFFLPVWLGLISLEAQGQGLTPAAAVARMQPAPGFQVSVVAAEPDIRQPVAIDFDERGRLWVMQYLQYPNPAGLKRVQVDRYSRTRYDRVPEPPPKGPRGADQLTILEPDPAQPGRMIAKNFVDGLNLASGFALGHGGVFVLQVPYLLFYPDQDRDDRPDSQPEVLLEGFGMEDAHSVANSLTWGPDGWLYGCQGSTVTAKVRGIEFQQGVWRYQPLTRRFELFCEGGGNSWGLDFDRHGHLLYSTNFGPHILLHGAQGGYFWKQFGKHGELHNPHAYGHIDHAPHTNPRGGHVTTGGIVYRGGQFPKSLEGTYIGADLLGHEILWHHLRPNGSSFRTELGGVLLAGNDPWFAPCDVCLGPDGSLYIADWHDQRTAHPDPDAEWDKTNGRVFRISHGKPAPLAMFDMGSFTREQLLAELTSANQWRVRTARRILAARRDPEVILPLRSKFEQSGDTDLALEYLWTLQVTGGLGEENTRGLLKHSHPPVRMWAVRLLGDQEHLSAATLEALQHLAGRENDIQVQRQLLCTAQRLPAESALAVLSKLLPRFTAWNDPQMPQMLWWAVEKHCVQLPVAATKLVQPVLLGNNPSTYPARIQFWSRLGRRLIAAGRPDCDLACVTLVSLPGMLEAMELGWRARIAAKGPAAPEALTAAIRNLPEALKRKDAIHLLAWMGNGEALDIWLARLEDPNLSPVDRARELETAVEVGPADRLRPLLERFRDAPGPLRLTAVSAWARLGESKDARPLLAAYAAGDSAYQARLRTALLSRKDWASQLLVEVQAKRIPAKDFSPEEVRGVAAFHDDELDRKVREVWGAIQPPTSEERLAEVRRLNNDLRAAKGNAMRGKLLFTTKCGNCHKLGGEGANIGPDLTQANRSDTQFLLVSLVDPSNLIRKEFLTHVVETRKGVTLSGIVVAQGPEGIMLVNAKNERTSIPAGEIENLVESPVSLMPENLLKDLNPEQLRDLFAYLQANSSPGVQR